MTEKLMIFNKNLEQLRENGEADFRISLLVNALDIETKHRKHRRIQMINKDYRETLCKLDHLDCAGFNLVDVVRQGTIRKSFVQSLEPFFGCNVQDFLKWMEDCKAILRKTRSTRWGSVSSMLHNVYAMQSIFMFEKGVRQYIIDNSIRCAIESENCILVSELVRTYLLDHDVLLQRIFEDSKSISPAIIDTILQTVKTLILRKFQNLQNNAIIPSFCWECSQENRLVMIISYKGNIEMADRIPNKVMGFKLVFYNFTQTCLEASSVFKSIPVSKKTPLPTVTEKEARELFMKHSNLTMISASLFKSIGYSKGRHRVVEKLCIGLFCLHKGYIPYGEERFPKQLGEFEVDVQEGYCVLGGGASLEIGGYICRAGCGSIGGFVDLPNNKTGLITCAHVIFSSKDLDKLESMDEIAPVIAFDRTAHTFKVCGTCTAAKFPKCFQQATSPQPNVDVALIELHPVIDTFGLRTVSPDQLYSAGFDPDNPPAFSGEVIPLPDPDPVHRACRRISDKLDSVVKYGAETGLTIGHLYHSGVHVRFIDLSLELPDNSRSVIMCDQIEIQNFPQGQFFECGDSGSFVFCINPDKTLSCLGMAVGLSLPQKSCLVTPIDRILRNLGLSSDCLKCCSSNASQGKLDKILAAIEDFKASLRTVETNFQASLQTVETNFQASLQTVERNIQRNFETLQSVQTEVRTLQSQVQQQENSKTQSNQTSANQN